MSKHVEKVLQILIIFACFIALIDKYIESSSIAQIQCNGEPTIKTNSDPDQIVNLKLTHGFPARLL